LKPKKAVANPGAGWFGVYTTAEAASEAGNIAMNFIGSNSSCSYVMVTSWDSMVAGHYTMVINCLSINPTTQWVPATSKVEWYWKISDGN
jgi:hypothetical protein